MDHILRLDENTRGNDWFVGDIHGCFSILEKQLSVLHFNPMVDRLICTGDLIDRGPESERALEFLAKSWFYSVRGNHDSFVLGDLNDLIHVGTWFSNGGRWWWKLDSEVHKNKFIKVFSTLPYVIEVKTKYGLVGVVHAELPEGLSWTALQTSLNEQNVINSLLWNRRRLMNLLSVPVEQVEIVVAGHTMLHKPVRLANCVFIDAGACVKGQFVLMNIEQLFNPSLANNVVDVIYNSNI